MILVLTGCSIFKPKGKTTTETRTETRYIDSTRIRDSIRIKDSINIQTRDSVIVRPGTNLEGSVSKPCDSTGKLRDFDFTLGSGVHRIRVWSDLGAIRFQSKTDSLVSVIREREVYIERLRDSLSSLVAKTSKDSTSVAKTNTVVTKRKWGLIEWLGLGLILVVVGAGVTKIIQRLTRHGSIRFF